MNLRKKLTLALLALALSLGTQSIAMSQASANPFGALVKSRKGGKRTHKKAGKSSSKDEKSDSKKRTTTSRRVVRRTTRPSSTNTTRTRHYRRPANSTSSTSRRRTSSTRTVRNVRPRTTSTRTVRNVRPRTTTTRTRTTTRVRRGSTSRRTYYRQGATRSHSHSHSHTTVNSRSGSTHRRGARVRDTSDSNVVEAYLTGGLGISGFASNEITDLPLPGAGYNLALGAKGKYVGGEFSLNGGGYTFEPGSGSTDIAMVGLSGDLKLQPSYGFFEPYIAAGVGGYAMKDAVIEEGATGLGLRLGAGADFRFRQFAVRVKYQHGSYGLNDVNGQYDGKLKAHTQTLGANLVVYF